MLGRMTPSIGAAALPGIVRRNGSDAKICRCPAAMRQSACRQQPPTFPCPLLDAHETTSLLGGLALLAEHADYISGAILDPWP